MTAPDRTGRSSSALTHYCTICHRALPDDRADAYACLACEHAMRVWLATIARDLPLLAAALVPGQSGPSTGSRFAGRAHAPLPVDGRALDLLGPGTVVPVPDPHGDQYAGIPLGPLLIGWARYIAAEFPVRYVQGGTEYIAPCDGPAARTGSGLDAWCRWLTAYLPHAVRQTWIGDLHDQLDDAVRRIRQVTGTRPRTHQRLAPCPACDAFGLCRTDGEWEITCGVCGHRMDPDTYDAHAQAVLPGLMTTMVRLVAADAASGTS